MSKKIGFFLALVGLCALSLFLVNCGSSSSHPTGILYVLTEGTSFVGNNVSSFAIDLHTGNLALINANASTCPTAASDANPEPCGTPLNILLDPTGATAFVLNQGLSSASVAPTIYSYTVNSDGSLGSPNLAATLALGDLPIAMTRDTAGQFLFVIDEGTDPSAANCQTAPPNYPNVQCASISVFAMTKGATSLSEVAGSPFPLGRIPSALSAITFSPPASATLPCGTTTDFLYLTFNSDPVLHNDNTLSAYCVDTSGTPNDLTANVPYTVPSSDPISVLAVNTNPAGENTGGVYVYVGSQPTASGALSIFQMCTQSGHGNCTLSQVTNETLIPVLPVPSAPGEKPVGMVVDPTNNYLYVVCELSNQVFGYRISPSTGALTTLNPVSRPTGSQPVALAMQPSVDSSGEFLYVSNSNSSNITGFAVSTTTGAMGDPITVISNPGPSGMAAQQ